jgi:hypothetical protein
MPNLEEVFRLSGVPTHTFVEPSAYHEILVSVRTPGRCLVIEGPSGIGKTTTITKVIEALGGKAVNLSARQPEQLEYIKELPSLGDIGTVIVDDFHRLDDATKTSLSDFMKVLADRQDQKSKIIIIGINKSGQQLIQTAHDLSLRMDIFNIGSNPTEKILELIQKGEAALGVELPSRDKIAEMAQGSFQIAQLLCHKVCILDGVTETLAVKKTISSSVNVVNERVVEELGRTFKRATSTFAQGSKTRREGRAPYLHLLKWLSETDDGALDVREAIIRNPKLKGSVNQVIQKNYLRALLDDPTKKELLEPYFHFDDVSQILSVEDPKLMYYLKNLIWHVFSRSVGYSADYFKGRYDIALSFAGADRELALKIFNKLEEHEVEVFYDENEQHLIVAANVEDYLAPIYRSEADYVVPLMSREYPKRIWTKFESDNFRERFGMNAVIAVRFTDVEPGFFSSDAKYGGVPFYPDRPIEPQVDYIVATICKRLAEDREKARLAEAEEAKTSEPSTGS